MAVHGIDDELESISCPLIEDSHLSKEIRSQITAELWSSHTVASRRDQNRCFVVVPSNEDWSTRMSLYLVLKGRQEGIFTSWAECHAMLNKYPGALYFKVKIVEEAKQKMEDYARLTSASSHIASQCNVQQVKNKGKQVISVDKSSTPSGKFGAEVTIAVLAGFLAGVRHQKILDKEGNN
ncbi:hypothetical protein AXF42_Ash019721 [Apostasia shenzhenica]|uniref:Ribonuclease H1 N-terminal domain-containing protein n=1 Tax=Apostasia shenzhenica TaxID=1088818 RepID=A0A2H9ZRP1_9ASPA|nr:hypothetical protein AXF42_Ash019721 [Apostasia shenzhenica]